MPVRSKPVAVYPKSKSIATITTAFSAIIFRMPDGWLKETLLVSVGLLAYFVYDSFVIIKRFVLREAVVWISLTITERRVRKYIRELEIEFRASETTSERLTEIQAEVRRYRTQLASRRFESLKC